MEYSEGSFAIFLARPNRFVALCRLPDGEEVQAHVKNTGRCRELLLPGVTVWLQRHHDPARKTAWSLVTVKKGEILINLDSQAPNQLVAEALAEGLLQLPGFETPTLIRREQRYRQSRFDFYLEQNDRAAFLEVKGVTLEEDGLALFPDAPTLRGVRHLEELMTAAEEGYGAFVLFVIQMKGVHTFSPNDRTHPDFGRTLRMAAERGVISLAMDCQVWPQGAKLDRRVEILL